ncbi:cytochrome B [Alkalilimnicola ehrlichii]|uniref:Cytochrome B n=2 Tax=Alkalilimnicola ehrlichii TaxID=351052 RepID=A0A3E0WMF8_9GAMM|nr:cytochrome B [Alkalilimnicola ehrlichii]RFA34160.1 cytochrome B [Alkalilimnicola ehrlichii]
MRFQFTDTPERYGSVSRFLHWSMALLLIWQLATAVARILVKDSALDEFLWGTHRPVGALLMTLVLIRIAWALTNRRQRPAAVSLMARLGHVGLYALLFFVPAFALLRQYGSGRAFSPFGIPLMPGFEGERIEWMLIPANLFHSWFGWLLFALIAGHIVMVFVHRHRAGDTDVLPRMLGRR